MAGMMKTSFSDEIIQQVRERTDIVEVISRYLTLQKKGQNYTGLCPFHQEKTPSFTVSSSKQLYHCFGCHAGGDVFGFLMQADSMNFPEVVRVLAEQAGIPLDLRSVRPGEISDHAPLLKLHQQAADYYHDLLLHHPEANPARQYLQKRGISMQTVQDFRLGYALPKWDGLLNDLVRQGGSTNQVERTGLVVVRENGKGHYDRFRDRLIIPIWDIRGRVIAFGARVLPETRARSDQSPGREGTQPKYINSPETPLFKKGQHLFALDHARAAVSRMDSLVVVEGYLDVLSAHQAGISNVVATMGTAMTSDHLHLIRRFTRKVILIFDPDQAGLRAVLRTVEIFLDSGVEARVVLLPEGEDPDSFIRSNGAQAFQTMLSDSVKLLDFSLEQLVIRASRTTIDEKLKVVGDVLPVLAMIPGHIERAYYIRWVAERLEVQEKDLTLELSRHLNRFRSRRGQSPVDAPVFSRQPAFPVEEEMLVKILLQGHIKVAEISSQVKPEDFSDQRLARIFQVAISLQGETGELSLQDLFLVLKADSDLHSLVSGWVLQDMGCEQAEYSKAAQDCIRKIRVRQMNGELYHLHEQIRQAEARSDAQAVRSLQEGAQSVKRRILQTQGEPV